MEIPSPSPKQKSNVDARCESYPKRKRKTVEFNIMSYTDSESESEVEFDSTDDEEDDIDEVIVKKHSKINGELSETFKKLFVQYQKFLRVDKGLAASTIEQNLNDVKKMVLICGARNLTELFEINCLRDKYIDGFCVKNAYLPDSVKKYLCSFSGFCVFLVVDKSISLETLKVEDILIFKSKIDTWKQALKKLSKARVWKKRKLDHQMLVTDKQLNGYYSGMEAQQALHLYEQLASSENIMIRRDMYVSMRNFLFVRIHFANAHRSGVSARFTIPEFAQCQWREKGELFVAGVEFHKTACYYGEAGITLTDEEYNWVKTFVDKARSQLVSIESENVFLSWGGKAMTSGDISQQIHQSFAKARVWGDIPPPKKLSCTIIRKTVSTRVRQKQPSMKGAVASLMAHSEKTADIHYAHEDKMENEVAGGLVIRKLFETKTDSPKRWRKEEELELVKVFGGGKVSIDHIKENMEKLVLVKDVTPRKIYDKVRRLSGFELEKKLTSSEVLAPKQHVENISDFASGSNKRSKLYTVKELRILHINCDSIIDDGGKINQSRIEEAMAGTGVLVKYGWSKLATRLRYDRICRRRLSKN